MFYMRKRKILRALRRRKSGYVSGADLAARLGISKVAIWKHIQGLRKEGYKVESKPKLGYRLVATPDLLTPYEIQEGLRTNLIGREAHYFEKVSSTQEVAKELAIGGAKGGTCVIAEVQTGGRGRRGRSWHSPAGGVYVSVIVRPKMIPTRAQLMTLLAGVATAKVLRGIYNLQAELKWPNDVQIGGKKVCGILIEIGAEAKLVNWLVIGIGINANVEPASFPREFRAVTTSLKKECGKEISKVELVRKLLEEIERLYLVFKERGPGPILDEWRTLTNTLGTLVRITNGGVINGKAVDVDQDGALIVKLADNTFKRVIAGDVSLRI